MSSDADQRAALLALLGRLLAGEQTNRMVLFQQAGLRNELSEHVVAVPPSPYS